jgi:hypothetical protein
MRDKEFDLDATRKYHEQNPPQVGDLVVVLHTASHYRMQKPYVTTIKAITDRGRIVMSEQNRMYWGLKELRFLMDEDVALDRVKEKVDALLNISLGCQCSEHV